MRTSNKIIAAALLLFALSLVIYDYQVLAKYKTSDYKNPYVNYIEAKIQDSFRCIRIDAASVAYARIVQGPYKILIEPGGAEYVRGEVKNDTLIISARFKDFFWNNYNECIVYISCPVLNDLQTDANYKVGGQVRTDSVASMDINFHSTTIEGFSGKNISIRADHASNILLKNNRISSIKINAGLSTGSGSNIVIGTGNVFDSSDIHLHYKSKLWVLDSSTIGKLNYHIDDEGSLILAGKAQQFFLKH
ncbi:MAG: hypothetical protein JST87_05615 [Bacteroidetes bacterium]|nr:hypothetical protein [Bacteroidota bacterium]